MPCLFFVACKEKESQVPVKSYTYSVVLKNAKDKIDESSLALEYDYSKSKNVGYSLDGNDYKLSVTKQVKLSGCLKVDLLEGYNYLGAEMTVNGTSTEFSIKSGSDTNVADKVLLNNRVFEYSYKNMSSDTNIIVDFSSCELVNIEVDVSSLVGKGITYKVVEDGFVTLQDGAELLKSFGTVSENKITVKYGTIVAFDTAERLATKTDDIESQQTMNYASYGLKYLKSTNFIQYFVAKTDVVCDSFMENINNAQTGTLRVPYLLGLNVASSLENLENKAYLTPTYTTEVYGGEEINIEVYSGETLYIERETENDYVYYHLDKIDEEIGVLNKIEISEGDTYFQVDVKDKSQYLMRAIADENDNYYYVYSSSLLEYASVVNADYVILGKNVISTSKNFSGEDVVYVFKKNKDVKLHLTPSIKDNEMTIEKSVVEFTVGEYSISPNETSEITLSKDNLSLVETDIYSLNISATVDEFLDGIFMVSFEELQLYSGETLYYSTDLKDADSWKKFEDGDNENIAFSSEDDVNNGQIVYYYIAGDRTDTILNLVNESGDEAGINSNAIDCFGRFSKETIEVDGIKIDLSRVRCLNIIPSESNANEQLYLTRQLDTHNHNIIVPADVQVEDVMISIGGIEENGFETLSQNLKLRINSNESFGSFIYYYVKGETNRHLVLKNADGEIVSKSQLVYSESEPYKINGKYVYRLALSQGTYAKDEEFTLSIEKSTYVLMYGELIMELYLQPSPNAEFAHSIAEGVTYHFLEENITGTDTYFQIVDESGNILVGKDGIQISGMSSSGAFRYYSFTLELADSSLYVPGTNFYLQKITQSA